MSKRDIQGVATLAAHLAQRQQQVETGIGCYEEYIRKPAECAADAMKLQRIGRSARNLVRKADGTERTRRWAQKIVDDGNTVCKPYGLGVVFDYEQAPHFFVVGLPGNTARGDGDGFGI